LNEFKKKREEEKSLAKVRSTNSLVKVKTKTDHLSKSPMVPGGTGKSNITRSTAPSHNTSQITSKDVSVNLPMTPLRGGKKHEKRCPKSEKANS